MKLTDEYYENKFTIRFSHVGQDRKLRYGCLTEYAENIAMDHSGYVGYDSKYFNDNDEAWAISYYHFKINDMPVENEVVTIRTWDRQLKRSQAHREITFCSEDGEMYIDCYARFVYMDTKKRRPKKLDPAFMENYYFADEKGFMDEDAPATFSLPETGAVKEGLLTTMRSDVNPSGHTSNAAYLPLAVDNVSDEVFDNRQLKDIKIMYKHEGFLGDEVRYRIYEEPCSAREITGEEDADDAVEVNVVFTNKDDENIMYAAIKMIWV